jgi:hypothetical protein
VVLVHAVSSLEVRFSDAPSQAPDSAVHAVDSGDSRKELNMCAEDDER